MTHAVVVVDLGFGDSGKGLVTDSLVRSHAAHTVVRFNGGAQAGHNVVTPDGRHHTFAQIGSGAFVEGVHTHLSRHVVVHPTALLVEAARLESVGVSNVLSRFSVSPEALVITPMHQAAGRLRELARGNLRHGSCGVGVGETVRDALRTGDDALRMLHLRQPLRRRLGRLQERLRGELDEVLRQVQGVACAEAEQRVLEDPGVADRWLDALRPLHGLAIDDGVLETRLRTTGAVVFEGAHGVLLDEWRGFHPHTTWSTCTPQPALDLLSEHGFKGTVTRLGVLRTYATRHGPGPFPTEQSELARSLPEAHNGQGPWQGAMRAGPLDLVLARYALQVSGSVDLLAVTHLDALERFQCWSMCQAYRAAESHTDLFELRDGLAAAIRLGPPQDLLHQEALTVALGSVVPVYEVRHNVDAGAYVEWLEEALGVPVGLAAYGPTARHVLWCGGRANPVT
ncbi:MAG: adenylosuccinate synthetase [Myxococcales bacterium]